MQKRQIFTANKQNGEFLGTTTYKFTIDKKSFLY